MNSPKHKPLCMFRQTLFNIRTAILYYTSRKNGRKRYKTIQEKRKRTATMHHNMSPYIQTNKIMNTCHFAGGIAFHHYSNPLIFFYFVFRTEYNYLDTNAQPLYLISYSEISKIRYNLLIFHDM